MKAWPWVVGGIIWAAAGLGLLAAVGTYPPAMLGALSEYPRSLTVVDLLRSDHLPVPWLLLPVALGIDLLIWTVGSIACLLGSGSWPGEALGRLVVGRPWLSWPMVVVASGTVGASLGLLPPALARVLRRS